MKNYVVVGLAFGDEGKGSIVDYLAHETDDSPLIVRFNGGPQAGHNVVTPNGKHHTFSQFGAGMFRDGADTHLSSFMLVNPLNLVAENTHLESVGVHKAMDRLTIAESAPVITPYHIALNRLRELSRGEGRHGSCGQGVGELMADMELHEHMVLRYADLRSKQTTRKKLEFWREYKEYQAAEFGPHHEAEVFNDDSLIEELIKVYQTVSERSFVVSDDYLDSVLGTRSVIFEGAQGVLLDETYGFNPYTTWSTTTPKNARELLGSHEAEVIGVVRTFYTRHGAGPFPTETSSINLPIYIKDPYNTPSEWQGSLRVGMFDETLFRYAKRVCAHSGGIDTIALTHNPRTPFVVANYPLSFDISKNPHPTTLDQAAQTAAIQSIDTRFQYGSMGMLHERRWINFAEPRKWKHFAEPNVILSGGPSRTAKERRRL